MNWDRKKERLFLSLGVAVAKEEADEGEKNQIEEELERQEMECVAAEEEVLVYFVDQPHIKLILSNCHSQRKEVAWILENEVGRVMAEVNGQLSVRCTTVANLERRFSILTIFLL